MPTAKSDLIKLVIDQLKLAAGWTVLSWIAFGLEVGRAMWKPHGDFYPIFLVGWGGMAAFSVFKVRTNLVQLPYTVPLEEADTTRMKLRGVWVFFCGTACISFCFGLCGAASRLFGGLYPFAAIAFGVLLLLIVFLMYRRIKRLASDL
jgi:hypothetical protein